MVAVVQARRVLAVPRSYGAGVAAGQLDAAGIEQRLRLIVVSDV
jgi:hypothetical protein